MRINNTTTPAMTLLMVEPSEIEINFGQLKLEIEFKDALKALQFNPIQHFRFTSGALFRNKPLMYQIAFDIYLQKKHYPFLKPYLFSNNWNGFFKILPHNIAQEIEQSFIIQDMDYLDYQTALLEHCENEINNIM